MRILPLAGPVAGLLVLSACGTVANGPDAVLDVRQAHPISIDQQTVVAAIPVDAKAQGLSRASLAEIDRIVTLYRTKGHGQITVTAPSGADDRASATTAADVRAALYASGIPYDAMSGGTVRGGQNDAVLVSFVTYVATGPVCGQYGNELRNRLANRNSQNFGCASQVNLAAMVADPRDLHRGTPDDHADDDGLTGVLVDRRAVETEVITYEIEDE